MAQIFHPSTNTISRVSLFSALFLIAFLLWLLAEFQRSSYITEANVEREQPVQFSHKHHVADDGIDCRYCHTSVETSAFAGIPPTKTCMNCHREPELYLRPRDQVFDMAWQPPSDQLEQGSRLAKLYKIRSVEELTSCSTCHR